METVKRAIEAHRIRVFVSRITCAQESCHVESERRRAICGVGRVSGVGYMRRDW